MTNPTKVCPICNKPSKDEFSPFCSKRCGDVDLNRWLGGQYAIPTSTPAGDAIDPMNDNEAPEE